VGVEGGLKKNIPGYQGAVSLMLLSKNMLFVTLGSQRNMYKNTLSKMSPLAIALPTLSSNISSPNQKENAHYVWMQFP